MILYNQMRRLVEGLKQECAVCGEKGRDKIKIKCNQGHRHAGTCTFSWYCDKCYFAREDWGDWYDPDKEI